MLIHQLTTIQEAKLKHETAAQAFARYEKLKKSNADPKMLANVLKLANDQMDFEMKAKMKNLDAKYAGEDWWETVKTFYKVEERNHEWAIISDARDWKEQKEWVYPTKYEADEQLMKLIGYKIADRKKGHGSEDKDFERAEELKKRRDVKEEYAVGDIVKVCQSVKGADDGLYGKFNIEKITPTTIIVYDHKTKETMKFNAKSLRGIGASDHLMIKESEEVSKENSSSEEKEERYADDIAKRLPADLKTEKDILEAGKKMAEKDIGRNSANYYFDYDENFTKDLIDAYMAVHPLGALGTQKQESYGRRVMSKVLEAKNEKYSVLAGDFAANEQAQKELDDCLKHKLHTVSEQKCAIKKNEGLKESFLQLAVKKLLCGRLDEAEQFKGTNVSHEPDGVMVLVMGPDADAQDDYYYGINVVFGKPGTKPDLVTFDALGNKQVHKYKAQIIAAAEKCLGKKDKEHLASL